MEMDRVSMEKFREMMDQIIEEIPQELFHELNGGVLLKEEEKLHPQHINGDLFIMGEYARQGVMGRYIFLYYGSFMRMYSRLPEEILYGRIRKTLLHELRHHLESLAGEKGLEVEDEVRLREYHSTRRPKEL